MLAMSQDFSSEVQSAAKALTGKMARAQELLDQGKIDEADKVVLDIFPAKERTAAQSYMLGNILFRTSPKVSYELHKVAFAKAPNEPNV